MQIKEMQEKAKGLLNQSHAEDSIELRCLDIISAAGKLADEARKISISEHGTLINEGRLESCIAALVLSVVHLANSTGVELSEAMNNVLDGRRNNDRRTR